MNSFFRTLSKTTLAMIIIAGGIFLLILIDPPHTLCDTQVSEFKKKQKTFLISGDKKILNKKTPPSIDKLIKSCVENNSPGGCLEYFYKLKTMLRDFNNVSSECSAKVGSIKPFKTALWDALELLVRSGWGKVPPAVASEKRGWLSYSDVRLYCKLKNTVQKNYGKDRWTKFRERLLKSLPKADAMERERVWSLVILSVNCSKYL